MRDKSLELAIFMNKLDVYDQLLKNRKNENMYLTDVMQKYADEQSNNQTNELLLLFLSKINKDAIDLYKEGNGQIVIDHFLKLL